MLITLFALVGCSNSEKTIEEVLDDEISYDIHEIIYKDEVSKDITMVLYSAGDVFEDGNSKANYLNVAFLKADPSLGWVFLGDKDWSLDGNGIMQVYEDTVHYQEDNDSKSISAIYGQILNTQIVEVEVGNENNEYVDAHIVEKNGEQYFYYVYQTNWDRVDESKNSNATSEDNTTSVGVYGFMAKGITTDGQVLIQQGGN